MTDLLYLGEFEVYECLATVTAVTKLDNGLYDIGLDRTAFYPRGGGQDWDNGRIIGANGELLVQEVYKDIEGIVHHLGKGIRACLRVGEAVEASVDRERRSTNTRLHSAGHLIDLVVEDLSLIWVPGRGAHYPHMSFVEYEAKVDPNDLSGLKDSIQVGVDQLVSSGGKCEIRSVPYAQIPTYCRYIPDYVDKLQETRIVTYRSNFGVPCGGTHVSDLSQIGKVTIRKVKKKDRNLRVSYSLESL